MIIMIIIMIMIIIIVIIMSKYIDFVNKNVFDAYVLSMILTR